jgi:hypothetical protein
MKVMRQLKEFGLGFALLLIFFTFAFGNSLSKIAVLVCDSPWIEERFIIDRHLKSILEKDDFTVAAVHYADVNPDFLRKFNVVVINWPVLIRAYGDDPKGHEEKWQMFEQFVREGGGLLLFGYHAGNPDSFDNTNQYIKRFGIRYLPQAIIENDPNKCALPEPSKAVLAIDYGRKFSFAKTENITPHSVTKGVRTIWYPTGWMYNMATLPIEANPNWTILVRGSDTAQSVVGFPDDPEAKKVPTIPSAPPFIACRDFGKGRIVAFASHPTFWMEVPFHRLWGYGFVYKNGDALQLLKNILHWLAEPSLKEGKLGGYQPSPPPPFKPVEAPAQPAPQAPSWQRNIFKGLIGAHTSYSDGYGTVAQFCESAKKAGYQFVVFTEDFQQMDEGKWESLVKDCERESKDGFLAIPGIKFVDAAGARYIAFDLQFFPRKEWIGDYENRIRRHISNMPGFYFGENWRPLAILAPHLNPHPASRPWFQKFYGAFSVFTYDKDKLLDDSLEWYLERMGNQYNSVPIAVHEIFHPEEVFLATKGVQTFAWAESLRDVPTSFRHHWYANPQMAFVSSGPILREWWIENSNDERSTRFALHIHITSEIPLEEISIYDGKRLWRRFLPKGKEFKEVMEGWHDQQRFFVLVAKDAKGNVLVSPTLWTSSVRHHLVMCTDMQNSMEGLSLYDPKTRKLVGGGVTPFNSVTGWDGLGLGIAVPWEELSPPGFDWGMSNVNIGASPFLSTTVGDESGIAQVDIHFANPYLAIQDMIYYTRLLWGSWATPMRLFSGYVRVYHFTPRIYGYDGLIFDSSLQTKQKITFKPDSVPNLSWLSISFSGGYTHYALLNRRGEVEREGEIKDMGELTIPKGGALVFLPGFAGGVAVFPLGNDLIYKNGRIGRKMEGDLPANTELKEHFLVIRLSIDKDAVESAREFGKAFGLMEGEKKFEFNVRKGSKKESFYPLQLEAMDGGVVFDFSDKGLPAGLPIIIEGLNDHWDTIVWRRGKGNPKVIGTKDGKCYFQLSQDEPESGTFYIGHLAVCDDPEIALSVKAIKDKSITLEVQNPTDKAKRAIVQKAKGLTWYPDFRKELKVAPGRSLLVEIKFSK